MNPLHHELCTLIDREHSRAQADRIIAWVGTSQPRFDALLALVLGPEKRRAQRASWPLSECAIAHPRLVRRHLPALLEILSRKGLHDALRRHIFRLLQFIDIPPAHHVAAASAAFDALGSPGDPVAVKVCAMTVLHRLAAFFPGLEVELRHLVGEQLPRQTAAFHIRARQLFGGSLAEP